MASHPRLAARPAPWEEPQPLPQSLCPAAARFRRHAAVYEAGQVWVGGEPAAAVADEIEGRKLGIKSRFQLAGALSGP